MHGAYDAILDGLTSDALCQADGVPDPKDCQQGFVEKLAHIPVWNDNWS